MLLTCILKALLLEALLKVRLKTSLKVKQSSMHLIENSTNTKIFVRYDCRIYGFLTYTVRISLESRLLL